MNHRCAAIAAAALLVVPAAPRADEGCGEVSNCRRITPAEDGALRQALRTLEAALPVPDSGKWERAATSDGMKEREDRLASAAKAFGAGAKPQLFQECVPSWVGCFPDDTAVTIGYQARGAGEKTQKKVAAKSGDALKDLLALGQAVADSMQYGVSLEVRLLPNPANNGCEQGEGYPKPVEQRKDFLHEAYESDGQATASLVFGERACQEPEELATVSGKTPIAPVRAVVVEVHGPTAEVKRLVAAIDRKAFAARVGPVVR